MFIWQLPVHADTTFPLSYHISEQFTSGEVIYAGSIGYLISPKPIWADESTILQSWSGYLRSNPHSSTLSGASILAAYPIGSNLLLLISRRNVLSLLVVDSLSHILTEKPLPSVGNVSSCQFIGILSRTTMLLRINSSLFAVRGSADSLQLQKITEDNVLAAASINGSATYITRFGNAATIHFLDSSCHERSMNLLPLRDRYSIQQFGTMVIVRSSAGSAYSFVDIFQGGRGQIASASVLSRIEFTTVITDRYGNATTIYLRQSGNNYALAFEPLIAQNSDVITRSVVLPSGYIEPLMVQSEGESIFVLFRNGIVCVSSSGDVLAADFVPIGEILTDVPHIREVEGYLLLSTPSSSILFERNTHSFWLVNRFIERSGIIVGGFVIVALYIILWRTYRRQKRVLNTALELPETGVVFVLDGNGRLLRANQSGRLLLGISGDVPLRRPFRFYCESEHELVVFIEQVLTNRIGQKQKIPVRSTSETKEFMWSAVPLFAFMGKFNGLIITGVDITEELERKRLVNWAQLAHDMQTNLSVIRLNAEQLNSTTPQETERRRKILHQSRLLMQKVRDIVTVGRSDQLDTTRVDAAELCAEVIGEFDEMSNPNVTLLMNARSVLLECDKTKLARALRNAVENGIRALQKENGTVELSARADERYVYFTVTDTGVGMDDEVKNNMLKPYFTTAKHEGGSGIGTMIMQRVVELHKGQLLVESEAGKGTTVTFKLPRR
jgi:signal transduction histidine kinase